MNAIKSRYVLAILLCSMGSPLHSAVGTEGASFLDIPVGARPAAMGGAYSALATDAYAPVWNPAGLGAIPDKSLATQYLSYLDTIQYEHLSYVHPLGGGRGLGGSIQYLGSGNIAGADAAGNSTGDFSSHYAAYSLDYGQAVTETERRIGNLYHALKTPYVREGLHRLV